MISAFLFWIVKDCLFLLGYLSGRQSFLKPLSPQEEREALLRMREGDETARQMLVEHNMRLIVHIARKYKVPGCTFDDLISIGSVGLIKAVRSYDMRTGTSLSTYAARCIENEILMFFRAQKKSSEDVSIQEPIDCDKDGNPLTLFDVMAGEEEEVFDAIQQRLSASQLRQAADRCLEPREAFVLQKRYGLDGGEPLPQREVAKQMGISRSYVSRLEKKALGQLRQELERMGYTR